MSNQQCCSRQSASLQKYRRVAADFLFGGAYLEAQSGQAEAGAVCDPASL